ncbi:MAG: DNA topoisomerase I subunit omega [Moraxellaceae bacterium]|nr:MAG: DNA topoisomerase I subunit omega [Moraxellaceae bacterium]
MGKSLVIVESPAKAKTINKYLGNNYIVKSSVGHIRDLPTSGSGKKALDPKARAAQAAKTRKMEPEEKAAYKKAKAKTALIATMGIDPENDWAARYEILPNKEKVVAELRRLADDADEIFLATDLDREGEAIAWHLKEVIGGDESRFKRVVFNEITKTAIQGAFEEPGKLDLHCVNAQQARRFLDRVVGYMVSPLLWAKVARGLSAGRVQSVAVKLVVEREREIRAFIPEEYWDVFANTKTQAQELLRLQVTKEAGKGFRPTNKEQTDKALEVISTNPLKITGREDKPTRSKPSAPFTTSTLQQAASTRLGFSVKKTMMMAQRLYEAGHITYMRTDSTNLSKEAVENCREFINSTYGKGYLPEQPVAYSSKEGAQEAHEAIRPTEVVVLADEITGLDPDANRLYDLIRRRFLACQMSPAEYLSSNISVTCGDFELRTRGRILKFQGHLAARMPGAGKAEEDVTLPDAKIGDVLELKDLDPSQHFTKPTARYTEASLVKELEKRGIGRPSTYASIISTIQDRGYAKVENRRFYAEKMGDIVTDRLNENFDNLMDFGFTASMEEQLDDIAEGKRDWKSVLNNFFNDFKDKIEVAGGENGMRANDPVITEDISCPSCSRPMMIRTGTTGVFLGCSGYDLPPKERCKETINLISGDDSVDVDEDGEDVEVNALRKKHRCSICSTAMESYLIDEERKLHVCGNNPDCSGHEIEKGAFKIKGYDGPIVDCDKCGSDMQLKSGRFGKYFGCTNEDCKNTRKLLRSGEVAPPKADPIPMPHLLCEKNDDHFLLRDGASGMFLAASQFPRHRETRAPLVEELLTVKDQLDPKFAFLVEAPVADPEGNKAIIRYSRKTKQQYVMSEVESKATGWKALFVEGKWEQTLAPKKVAKKKAPAKKTAAKKKSAAKKK